MPGSLRIMNANVITKGFDWFHANYSYTLFALFAVRKPISLPFKSCKQTSFYTKQTGGCHPIVPGLRPFCPFSSASSSILWDLLRIACPSIVVQSVKYSVSFPTPIHPFTVPDDCYCPGKHNFWDDRTSRTSAGRQIMCHQRVKNWANATHRRRNGK